MPSAQRDSNRPTSEHSTATSVVVVGGPDVLVEATRSTTGIFTQARIRTCELADAATTIAEVRPFAIVVSQSIYGFDCDEFDALARDVGARLLKLNVVAKSRTQLEKDLLPGITRAFREFHTS